MKIDFNKLLSKWERRQEEEAKRRLLWSLEKARKATQETDLYATMPEGNW